MERIKKINGFVYLVEGEKKGFETFYNLGKDIDSPIWKEEENDEKPKKVKTKKEED